MKIAVIGCGASGLAALRRCQEAGLDCVGFELSGRIGGNWKCGAGEISSSFHPNFGVSFPSDIYPSLKMNLPHQLMEFPDFKFESFHDESVYPGYEDVEKYLHDFAEHFDLKPRIKFHHLVTSVSKINDKWEIYASDSVLQEYVRYEFDAVMICSGNRAEPFVPEIPGAGSFQGGQIHVQTFQRKTDFKDKNVLIVGDAHSALDLIFELSGVTGVTYLSHNGPMKVNFPRNLIQKGPVTEIEKNSAKFLDGTSVEVDDIIYCTGYKYSYPFLNPNCGITVENFKIVRPLYKHFININEPSMCFIGLLEKTFLFYLFDLQARVFLRIAKGDAQLPPKGEMLAELKAEQENAAKKEITHFFYTNKIPKEYFHDLSRLGNLEEPPAVYFKIYEDVLNTINTDFGNLRNVRYKIINDEEYDKY